MANHKIDIPYIPKVAERFAIKFVIGLVIKAARKKFSFAQLIANSKNLVVPDSDDDIELLVAG